MNDAEQSPRRPLPQDAAVARRPHRTSAEEFFLRNRSWRSSSTVPAAPSSQPFMRRLATSLSRPSSPADLEHARAALLDPYARAAALEVVQERLASHVATNRKCLLLSPDSDEFLELTRHLLANARAFVPRVHGNEDSRAWQDVPFIAQHLTIELVTQVLTNEVTRVRRVVNARTFWIGASEGGVTVQHAASGIRLRAANAGNGFGTLLSNPERVPELAASESIDGAPYIGLGIGRLVYLVTCGVVPNLRWRLGHPITRSALGVRHVLHSFDPWTWEVSSCVACDHLGIRDWQSADLADFSHHPRAEPPPMGDVSRHYLTRTKGGWLFGIDQPLRN